MERQKLKMLKASGENEKKKKYVIVIYLSEIVLVDFVTKIPDMKNLEEKKSLLWF